MKTLLKKKHLVFEPGETLVRIFEHEIATDVRKDLAASAAQILNFYERMAIGVFKNTLDEDICYDDKGFLFLSFYRWAEGHIKTRRADVRDGRIWANVTGLARRWQRRYARDVQRIEKLRGDELLIIQGRDVV